MIPLAARGEFDSMKEAVGILDATTGATGATGAPEFILGGKYLFTLHALFLFAIVSLPFAVAISAPVSRPAAGGNSNNIARSSGNVNTTGVSLAPNENAPGVLQTGNAPGNNSLIAAVPSLCENKVVFESTDLNVNSSIAAVPSLCENKVVFESTDLDENSLIAAVPSLCTNKVVTESADLNEKSLIAVVPPLCEIKVVS